MPTILPSTSATQQREAGLSVNSKRNDLSGHGRLNDILSNSTAAGMSSMVIFRIKRFMRVLARQHADKSVPEKLHRPLCLPASAPMPARLIQQDGEPIAQVKQDAHWFSFLRIFAVHRMSIHRTQWTDSRFHRSTLRRLRRARHPWLASRFSSSYTSRRRVCCAPPEWQPPTEAWTKAV